jgi:hypothetical protein
MNARVIGTILFTVLVVAAPGARQQGSATGGQTPTPAKPPAAKRAVIVTGENSFNGACVERHVGRNQEHSGCRQGLSRSGDSA